MTIESFGLNESTVRLPVCSIEDNSKVNLTTQFNLLQQLTYADVNNRKSFLRSLIKYPFIITHDVANNVVTHIKKCDNMPNENS